MPQHDPFKILDELDLDLPEETKPEGTSTFGDAFDNVVKSLENISNVAGRLNPFTAPGLLAQDIPGAIERGQQEAVRGSAGAIGGLEFEQKKNFISDVVIPVLDAPGRAFTEGRLQISENPLAGGIKIAESFGHLIATPFSALDQTLRHHGLETQANIIAYPFEKTAEGVAGGTALIDTGLEAIGFDKKKQNEALRLLVIGMGVPIEMAYKDFSDEKLDQIATNLNQFNQLLAQFAIPIGAKGIAQFVKGRFPKQPSKVSIDPSRGEVFDLETGELIGKRPQIAETSERTKRGEPTVLESEFEQVSVGEVGFEAPDAKIRFTPEREIINSNLKIDIANARQRRGELIKRRDALNTEIKETKKRSPERKAKLEERRDVVDELNLLDESIETDTKFLEVTGAFKEVRQVRDLKQIDDVRRTPVEGAGENVPSEINFAIATEPGARTISKVTVGGRGSRGEITFTRTAPVKRGVAETKTFNLFPEKFVEKRPLDTGKLKKILDFAEENGIYNETLGLIRNESFKRGLNKEFEQALSDVGRIKPEAPPEPVPPGRRLVEPEIIERTNKNGNKYYYNTRTKKIAKKEDFIKQQEERSGEVKEQEAGEVSTEQGEPPIREPEVKVEEGTPLREGEGEQKAQAEIRGEEAKPTEPVSREKTTDFNDKQGLETFTYKGKPNNFTQERTFVQESIDKLLSELEGFNDNVRIGRDINFEIGDFKATIENPTLETLKKIRTNTSKTLKAILRADLISPRIIERGINPKGKIDLDAVNRAKERLSKKQRENLNRTNIGVDPSMIPDLAIVGADFIRKGAKTLREFTKAMQKEYGKEIRPFILRIHKQAKIIAKEQKKEVDRVEIITDEGTITEAELIKNRELMEQRGSTFNKTRESIKREVGSFRFFAKEKLVPKDSRLLKIDPEIYRQVKKAEFNKMVKHRKEERIATNFLDPLKKAVSKDAWHDLDILFKNELEGAIRDVLKKEGGSVGNIKAFEDAFGKVKVMLENFREELGIPKTKPFYWPRMVKDPKGYMDRFYEVISAKTGKDFTFVLKDIFDRLILDKEARIGRELTIEEMADVINGAMRGYNPGITLARFANEFKRAVDVVDAEMSQFMHDFDASLMSYVEQARTKLETRRFFGQKSGDSPAVNESSIGRLIAEGKLRTEKPLKPEDLRELTNILRSGFEPRGTTGFMTMIKEVGYITRLFNYLGAMTQLGDFYATLYRAPVRGFGSLARAFISPTKLIHPSDVQLRKIAYDVNQMAKEFADPRQRGKIMKRTVEWSFFKFIDVGMKETFANTLFNQYKRLAKADKLKKGHKDYWRFEKRFGDRADEVIQEFADIEAENMTGRMAFQLLDELDAIQPITVWSTPEAFNTSGQAQIVYQMKTFALRRIDFVLNESVRRMRNSTLPTIERLRAGKSLAGLLAAIVLSEGSVDIAKDILKGRPVNIPDIVLDNLLGIVLMSRYDAKRIKRDGLASAIVDKLSPVLGLFDDVIRDMIGLFGSKSPEFRTIRNFPVAGELIYNWIRDAATTKKGRGSRSNQNRGSGRE